MSTNDITHKAAPATLTENELWHRFLAMRIEHRCNLGYVTEEYTPYELLLDSGDHCCLTNISDEIAVDLASASDITQTLRIWISELENYCSSLKVIGRDFNNLAERLRYFPKEPAENASEAEHAAFDQAFDEADNNPRYRQPTLPDEVTQTDQWSPVSIERQGRRITGEYRANDDIVVCRLHGRTMATPLDELPAEQVAPTLLNDLARGA